VVLGVHQLAMHYSLSLVDETVIFYHALTRVLGNDKRLSVELPVQWHGFQPTASGFVPLSMAEFSL